MGIVLCKNSFTGELFWHFQIYGYGFQQFLAFSGPRGGTCENFDRDARVIFLGLKFTKMSFFWVSLSWRHFFGVEKIGVIFLGSLKICVIFLGY